MKLILRSRGRAYKQGVGLYLRNRDGFPMDTSFLLVTLSIISSRRKKQSSHSVYLGTGLGCARSSDSWRPWPGSHKVTINQMWRTYCFLFVETGKTSNHHYSRQATFFWRCKVRDNVSHPQPSSRISSCVIPPDLMANVF